jgi:hypothetical protein
MNKLIIAAVAAAGLASGLAFAQANNPEFTGVQPGIAHPEYGPQTRHGILYNSGVNPDKVDPPYVPEHRRGFWGDRGYQDDRRIASRATRNDRDGDGIRNSRDRHPDDARFR